MQTLIELYMREVGRVPLLDAAQEKCLGTEARAGSVAARRALIVSNLRLVVRIAHRFRGRGLELEDLVAEGNVGLIRAVDKFDPGLGCRFSTYATWWIEQAVRIALRTRSRIVRIPSHMVDRMMASQRVAAALERTLGRSPTRLELREALGVSAAVAAGTEAALAMTEPVCSLSAGGGERELADALGDPRTPRPHERPQTQDEVARIEAVIGRLEPRLQDIVRLHYGLGGGPPQTLLQIGRRLGVTRERVRQLEQQALRRLKRELREAAA